MNLFQAVKSCFTQYVGFSGRAPRSEYWYWVLFCYILGFVLGFIIGAFSLENEDGLLALMQLALLLPGIAVTARRLHDVGRSGWWMLLFLTLIGVFVLLYWYCKRGTVGENKYGPDPLQKADVEVV